jgi:hypothetical protein
MGRRRICEGGINPPLKLYEIDALFPTIPASELVVVHDGSRSKCPWYVACPDAYHQVLIFWFPTREAAERYIGTDQQCWPTETFAV